MSKVTRGLIAACLMLISMLICASLAFASAQVGLEIVSNSFSERTITIKITYPQNTAELRLFRNGVLFKTTYPDAAEEFAFIDVDIAGNGIHEYKAFAYGSDGLSTSESDVVVFSGIDYAPQSPSWNLKNEDVITGRLHVYGNVDDSVQAVFLVINGKIAYRTTPINGKYEFKNVGLLDGKNYLQVITENAWGRGYTESIRVLSPGMPRNSTYILINKSELTLTLIENGKVAQEFPVAIGTPSTPTPVGLFRVGEKLVTSPKSDWGARRITLLNKTKRGYRYAGYSIHGTNRSSSIGKMASHGCIRLYNDDIVKLYNMVPKGMEVQIVP